MTCACCETGRCCKGATCTTGSASECAFNSGTFTAGGDCSAHACIDNAGKGQCSVTDACVCAITQEQSVYTTLTTCNCATLQANGYSTGGCRWYYCEKCNTSTGACVWGCDSIYQDCCAGTCCPLSQRCASGTCVNKCTTGTFCAGTGSAYACCTSGQKCCGSSGCLSVITANFTVDVRVNDWVNTGVTLAAGTSVAITATASCDRCAAGTVEWAGQGSTATPNGVSAGDCSNGNSVAFAICHMALIGKIGAGGTPFLVGSSYSGTPGAGLLYLRQNDTNVGDNRGAFTGTITTDPCPGYTPAAVGEPIVYGPGEEPPKQLPGPGAALKSILSLAGIVSSPTCSCNARAAQMDSWGEWESLKRLPEICDWLKEEADKREMWFFRPAGYALVLAAVFLSALKRPFRGNNK